MTFPAPGMNQRPRAPHGRAVLSYMYTLAIVLMGMSLLSSGAWSQVPHDMTYQGQLTDSVGAPLSGPVELDFGIFDVLVDGAPLYSEGHADVPLDDQGAFSVQMGAGIVTFGSFDPALFSGVNRYLEVTIDGEVLSPRAVLGSVPWSLVAEEATTLQGLDVVAQLGSLSTSVATAQSAADSAQSDASFAQAAADANTTSMGGLGEDVTAIEDALGDLPEGSDVAETLGELEEVAISDNGDKQTLGALSGSPLSGTSIALFSAGGANLPMVTYRDPDSRDLILGTCGVSGSSWDCSSPVLGTAFENGDTLEDPYAPVLSGPDYPMVLGTDLYPLIAYIVFQTYPAGPGPASSEILKVLHCNNPTPCVDDTSTTLEWASSDEGESEDVRGVSMVLGSDGFALLSYYRVAATWDPWNWDDPGYTATTQLRVVHCENIACTSHATTTLYSSSSSTFSADTSIAIGADGLAIISFYNDDTDDLMVAHCDDLACTGATVSTLDSTDSVGSYSSIAVGEDGIPIVSYYDATQDDLKVARCETSACLSATISTLDTEGDVGSRNHIGISACGLPFVAYYDKTKKDVKLARCVDAACENTVISVIDSEGAVGSGLSMVVQPDGGALMSYVDLDSGEIKIVSSQPGYLWDAICMAKDMASAAQATADSMVPSCGSLLVPAAVCPIGELDGPRCDAVLAGSFCEGDGECTTSAILDNCGPFDWYFKVAN